MTRHISSPCSRGTAGTPLPELLEPLEPPAGGGTVVFEELGERLGQRGPLVELAPQERPAIGRDLERARRRVQDARRNELVDRWWQGQNAPKRECLASGNAILPRRAWRSGQGPSPTGASGPGGAGYLVRRYNIARTRSSTTSTSAASASVM